MSAQGWADQAERLARWAWQQLKNRADAYGAYSAPEDRGRPYVRADGKAGVVPKNYTAKRPLTPEALARHFRGERPEHVIGLHSTSPWNTCLWGAFDIDRHSDGVDPAETHARASRLYRAAQQAGFRPLLIDADGNGGYHLWLLFRTPAPAADVYHLLRRIAAAAGHAGEQFPKQAGITAGGYGNWLRLPGRHHTRGHWAQVFDGSRWARGAAAVEILCGRHGDDARLVPPAPPSPAPPRRQGFRVRANLGPFERRVVAYLARCPNLSEGQGRDDVAYRAAAMIARDMGLADADTLDYLEAWDSHNAPPKGRRRLEEILQGAHRYGRHAYGSCRSARGHGQ